MRLRTTGALGFALALSALATAGARADSDLSGAVRVERGRCVSADGLVRAIAAWRGTSAVGDGLHVTVTEGPGARARFVVRRGDALLGERDIDAANASCRELGDALALLIAVALDAAEADEKRAQAAPSVAPSSEPAATAQPAPAPTAAAPAPTGEPAAPPGSAAPGPPPSTPARRTLTIPRGFGAPPPAPPPSRYALEVTAGGGAGFDIVPARVAVVNAAAGLHIGPRDGLAAVLRGGVLATSTGLLPLGDGQAEARLLAGRADACALWMPTRAGLEACAGLAAGMLWARGIGFDADKETGAPWMAAAARLAGRLTLVGPLALSAGVDTLVPVLVPRIEVQSSDLITTVAEVPVPPIGVGLFLGLAFTFP